MFPVIFVSLGPGEPELITVKGLKALQTADCIFCPETLAKDGNRVSRAADILLQLDIPENTVHRFPLPMSKQREKALSAYDEVYMESSTLRQQGKKVCIVAEGDAGFYSSIHYVYDKLQADGIPVKHIPGIPAFIAAGALGGLHVASQEERLTVCPGKVDRELFDRVASGGEVAVVMKLSQCEEEVKRLIGLEERLVCHYFENVGTDVEYYTCHKEDILARKFPYFSLMIIKSR